VLVGDGSGNFTPPAAGAVQLLEGSYPMSAVLGELDGTADSISPSPTTPAARCASSPATNDGTFGGPADYSTGSNPRRF